MAKIGIKKIINMQIYSIFFLCLKFRLEMIIRKVERKITIIDHEVECILQILINYD
jgi:hypothetical protein